MINAEFFKKNEILTGFTVKNHSGYAENGKDIVCSAVTSAVQMAINTITDVALIDAKSKADEEKAVISIELRDKDIEKINLFNIVLQGLLIQLKNIQEVHKDFIHIKITEV